MDPPAEDVPAPAQVESPSADPHWLGDWKPYQDAVLYGQTLRSVIFHPHQFAGRWVRKEVAAFNPAAFYLVLMALEATARSLSQHLQDKPGEGPWQQAAENARKYALTLFFAGLVHHSVSARVPNPRPFRSTVAATLCASGASSILLLPLTFASIEVNGPGFYTLFSMASLAALVLITSLCLTGVHGLNLRIGLTTVLFAGFATTVLWLGAWLLGQHLGVS